MLGQRRHLAPSECDDGPFGNGTGGELRYSVTVPARGAKTLWVAAAGSDQGMGDAQSELRSCAAGPRAASWRRSWPPAPAWRKWSQVSLPGDPTAAAGDRLGQAEPRRPHADRVGPADPLDQPGQAVPGAAGHGRARDVGSAPASPTTRGCSPPTASTRRSPASRSASSRPSRTTCARCATSPTSSTTAPAWSCTRRSPTARSTSATTRRPRRPTAPRRTTSTPTRRSSSRARRARLALDGRQPLPRRDVRLRQAQPACVDQRLTGPDGWPEGSGNVERTGMGPEKLDNAVYYIRALARPRRHGALQARRAHRSRGRRARPASCRAQFEGDLVGARPPASTPTRCTTPATTGLPEALDRVRCRWRPS